MDKIEIHKFVFTVQGSFENTGNTVGAMLRDEQAQLLCLRVNISFLEKFILKLMPERLQNISQIQS